MGDDQILYFKWSDKEKTAVQILIGNVSYLLFLIKTITQQTFKPYRYRLVNWNLIMVYLFPLKLYVFPSFG